MARVRPGKRERQATLGRTARVARTANGIAAGKYVTAWSNPEPRGKASMPWGWDWKASRRINQT